MKLSLIPNYAAIFAAALFLAIGCKKSESNSGTTGNGVLIDSTYASGAREGSTETGADATDIVENSSFTNVVSIDVGDNGVTASAMGDVVVTPNGFDIVVVSHQANVVYQLNGSYSDVSVTIYSDDDYKVVLNGSTFTNADGPVLNLQSTKKAFIQLSEGTTTTLKDGSSYTNTTDANAAIYALGPVIFSGKGYLSVSGKYKYAIASAQYVRVRNGNIYADALLDGVHTTAGFLMDSGYLKVKSEANGIYVENGYAIVNYGTIDISAEVAGVSAGNYINVNGGSLNITAATGAGLESETLTFNNGSTYVQAGGNGVNAGKTLYVNNGYVGAGGKNGLHSGGDLTVTGGVAIGVSKGQVASGFDCPSGTFKITGGRVLGAGLTTSSPDANTSTVTSFILGGGTANTIIHIEEGLSKNEILTFAPFEDYQTLLYASSKVQASTSYLLFKGGYVSGNVGSDTVAATYGNYSLYKSGAYVSETGKKDTAFNTIAVVTQIGGTIK